MQLLAVLITYLNWVCFVSSFSYFFILAHSYIWPIQMWSQIGICCSYRLTRELLQQSLDIRFYLMICKIIECSKQLEQLFDLSFSRLILGFILVGLGGRYCCGSLQTTRWAWSKAIVSGYASAFIYLSIGCCQPCMEFISLRCYVRPQRVQRHCLLIICRSSLIEGALQAICFIISPIAARTSSLYSWWEGVAIVVKRCRLGLVFLIIQVGRRPFMEIEEQKVKKDNLFEDQQNTNKYKNELIYQRRTIIRILIEKKTYLIQIFLMPLYAICSQNY